MRTDRSITNECVSTIYYLRVPGLSGALIRTAEPHSGRNEPRFIYSTLRVEEVVSRLIMIGIQAIIVINPCDEFSYSIM